MQYPVWVVPWTFYLPAQNGWQLDKLGLLDLETRRILSYRVFCTAILLQSEEISICSFSPIVLLIGVPDMMHKQNIIFHIIASRQALGWSRYVRIIVAWQPTAVPKNAYLGGIQNTGEVLLMASSNQRTLIPTLPPSVQAFVFHCTSFWINICQCPGQGKNVNFGG